MSRGVPTVETLHRSPHLIADPDLYSLEFEEQVFVPPDLVQQVLDRSYFMYTLASVPWCSMGCSVSVDGNMRAGARFCPFHHIGQHYREDSTSCRMHRIARLRLSERSEATAGRQLVLAKSASCDV